MYCIWVGLGKNDYSGDGINDILYPLSVGITGTPRPVKWWGRQKIPMTKAVVRLKIMRLNLAMQTRLLVSGPGFWQFPNSDNLLFHMIRVLGFEYVNDRFGLFGVNSTIRSCSHCLPVLFFSYFGYGFSISYFLEWYAPSPQKAGTPDQCLSEIFAIHRIQCCRKETTLLFPCTLVQFTLDTLLYYERYVFSLYYLLYCFVPHHNPS